MYVYTVAINILLRWSKEGSVLCVVSELLTDIVNRFLVLNSRRKNCPNYSKINVIAKKHQKY